MVVNVCSSLKDCQDTCRGAPKVDKSRDHCNLASERGRCTFNITSWFFDTITGECRSFIFSGCGGNANNFPWVPISWSDSDWMYIQALSIIIYHHKTEQPLAGPNNSQTNWRIHTLLTLIGIRILHLKHDRWHLITFWYSILYTTQKLSRIYINKISTLLSY